VTMSSYDDVDCHIETKKSTLKDYLKYLYKLDGYVDATAIQTTTTTLNLIDTWNTLMGA